MSNQNLVSVREGEPGDEAFIYQTWLKGYLYGNPHHRGMDIGTYERGYRPVIAMLLKRSKVRVACDKTDHTTIFGYSVAEGNKLHWIFVKKAFQGFGISKLLLPEGFDSVSHKTRLGETILKAKYPAITFNPFL